MISQGLATQCILRVDKVPSLLVRGHGNDERDVLIQMNYGIFFLQLPQKRLHQGVVDGWPGSVETSCINAVQVSSTSRKRNGRTGKALTAQLKCDLGCVDGVGEHDMYVHSGEGVEHVNSSLFEGFCNPRSSDRP